jgi:hypothetical protein
LFPPLFYLFLTLTIIADSNRIASILGKFTDEKMHKILHKNLLKLPIDKNTGAQDRAPAAAIKKSLSAL